MLRPTVRGQGRHLVTSSRAPRVLVAEDDADMRRLVGWCLRLDGHEVHELEDGARLFDLVHGRSRIPGDLLVCDVFMPHWTGLELLAHMRAMDRTTPVILMTAFPDERLRREVEALGAVLFDKPFELDDLRTAVMHLLAH